MARCSWTPTLPSPEFAPEPQALVDLLLAARPLDLVVAPSGYGLPLVPIEEFGAQERFLFYPGGRARAGKIAVLGGHGQDDPADERERLAHSFCQP